MKSPAKAPKQPASAKKLTRAEDQTTITFSLDRDLAMALRERAQSLRVGVSAYLRMLADQDIGGNPILIAGAHKPAQSTKAPGQ